MKYRRLAAFGALHGVVAFAAFACGSPADGGMGGASGASGTAATSGGASSGGTTTTTTGGTTTTSGGVTTTGGTTTATGGTTTTTGGTTTTTGGTTTTTGGTSAGAGGTTTGGATTGGVNGGGTTNGGVTSGGAATGGASKGGATSGGASGTGGGGGTAGVNSGTGGNGGASTGGLAKFSFFAASYAAMQTLAKTADGFGGDLRYGETGDGAGLRGADKICTAIAEKSMPGSSVKIWRAYLSAPAAGASPLVNARDRIGAGPWYDRLGRLVATGLPGLFETTDLRPDGDAAIKNDLPNENGVLNHNPDNTGQVDNHDFLTGSDDKGNLYAKGTNPTCSGWTTAVGSAGKPRCGHTWPRGKQSWSSVLDEAGCGAGVNLVEMGGPDASDPTVGSGGGYGGIYCFALAP